MQKIELIVTSRVFWTLLIAIAVAVVPVIRNLLSPTAFTVIETVLAILVNYFNVSPTPAFTAKIASINAEI